MANQYTSKKAKAAARKTVARESGELPVRFIPLSPHFAEILSRGMQPPRLNSADEKAKTQPHFTLLPGDNFTPVLISEWIEMAERHGAPVQKILDARHTLKRIEDWRTKHPTTCKTPD